MQAMISRLRQSASTKVFTIAFLVLVLLIPLQMVENTIWDRDQVSQSAQMDIQQSWGGAQLIAGPVLLLPYDIAARNSLGEPIVQRGNLYLLPQALRIDATVESEIRYRGIHKVPVYSANVALQGRFDAFDIEAFGLDANAVHWDEASILIGISDSRAIATTPDLELNGRSISFAPAGQLMRNLPPQIGAALGTTLSAAAPVDLKFSTQLNLKGSNALRFLPLGDTTVVTVASPWPSPSFVGSYLPQAREITADGFSADWKVSSIGRTLPSSWTDESGVAASAEASAFGVELYMPISIYRLTLRAVTYGVLFIGLTFVCFFLFEVVSGQRLHPIQYLMVGLANCVFFLLLISLAEHFGFGWAYLCSAVASSGLIIYYSHAVLGGQNRAAIIGLVLLVLYSFLFMTLQAETYALLAGAIALWVVLAAVMLLTRRINWYERFSTADQNSSQQELTGL